MRLFITSLFIVLLSLTNSFAQDRSLQIKIIDEKESYCETDSVQVQVEIQGDFPAEQKFTIGWSVKYGILFEIKQITESGIYTVKLPPMSTQTGNGGYANDLHVYPSNYFVYPTIIASIPIKIVRVPSESTLQNGAPYFFIRPGIGPDHERSVKLTKSNNEQVSFFWSWAEEIGYTRNGIEYVEKGNSFVANDTYLEGQEVVYSFHRVSNACGTIELEKPYIRKFESVPYSMTLHLVSDTNTQHFCIGQENSIRFFASEDFNADQHKLTLQIEQAPNSNLFEDIESRIVDNQIIFTVPNKPTGNYVIRTRDQHYFYSTDLTIQIQTPPTVQLTSENKQTYIALDHPNSITLVPNIIAGTITGVHYSDSTKVVSSPFTHSPLVNNLQEFTITNVWNECGNGTAQGKVTANVGPVLQLNDKRDHQELTICPTQELSIDYTLLGASLPMNDSIQFALVNEAESSLYLGSTKQHQGQIQFTLPSDLDGQLFNLVASISTLNLSTTIPYKRYQVPSLTLFGNSTITDGQLPVVHIKVNKPFVDTPIVTLSDGHSYPLYQNEVGSVNTIALKSAPTQLTTYTLQAIEHSCGKVETNGSATITVIPKQEKYVHIRRVRSTKGNGTICSTDTLLIDFSSNTLLEDNNEYEVVLKDSTGQHSFSIVANGTSSPLRVVIPNHIPRAANYQLLLFPKDSTISGSVFQEWIQLLEYPHVMVTSPLVEKLPNNTANVSLSTIGAKPIDFTIQGGSTLQHFSSTTDTSVISLPLDPQQYVYHVTAAKNVCGTYIPDSSASVEIELITAILPDDEIPLQIEYGPNPTKDAVILRFKDSSTKTIQVINNNGNVLDHYKSQHEVAEISLRSYATGIYYIHVLDERIKHTIRIIKH